LSDGFFGPGTHSCDWDARNDQGGLIAPGIYVCSLKANDFRASQRIVVLPK